MEFIPKQPDDSKAKTSRMNQVEVPDQNEFFITRSTGKISGVLLTKECWLDYNELSPQVPRC